MGLERTNCANHPDRYGHALCMTCRKTLCQECATEWDGIFTCTPCLSTRRGGGRRGFTAGGWILLAIASAALAVLAPHVLVWGSTLWIRSLASP